MSIKSVDLLSGDLGPLLLRALDGLQFGAVEIVVHEGRVVHVERRERLRVGTAGRRLPDNRGRDLQENHRTDRCPGGSDTDDGETSR